MDVYGMLLFARHVEFILSASCLQQPAREADVKAEADLVRARDGEVSRRHCVSSL